MRRTRAAALVVVVPGAGRGTVEESTDSGLATALSKQATFPLRHGSAGRGSIAVDRLGNALAAEVRDAAGRDPPRRVEATFVSPVTPDAEEEKETRS